MEREGEREESEGGGGREGGEGRGFLHQICCFSWRHCSIDCNMSCAVEDLA